MPPKDGEHQALIFWTKVEEAVPCQNPVKTLVECQLSHVHNLPVVIWEARLAHRNKGRRGIDTGDIKALPDAIPAYGLSRSTADIENGSPRLQTGQKSVDRRLIVKIMASYPIELFSVTLVQANDLLGFRYHP